MSVVIKDGVPLQVWWLIRLHIYPTVSTDFIPSSQTYSSYLSLYILHPSIHACMYIYSDDLRLYIYMINFTDTKFRL